MVELFFPRKDIEMKKGVSTVIATILLLIITIALVSLAYVYIYNIIPQTVINILGPPQSSCVQIDTYNGSITVWLKNNGRIGVNTTGLTLTSYWSQNNPLAAFAANGTSLGTGGGACDDNTTCVTVNGVTTCTQGAGKYFPPDSSIQCSTTLRGLRGQANIVRLTTAGAAPDQTQIFCS